LLNNGKWSYRNIAPFFCAKIEDYIRKCRYRRKNKWV